MRALYHCKQEGSADDKRDCNCPIVEYTKLEDALVYAAAIEYIEQLVKDKQLYIYMNNLDNLRILLRKIVKLRTL